MDLLPEGGTANLSVNLPDGSEAQTSVYRSPRGLQPDWNQRPASSDLMDYWRILRLHRRLILRCTVLGLLGALLFSLFQARVYQARTMLAIQDLNENFVNLKEETDRASTNDAVAEPYFLTQIKILQSEALLEHVVHRLGGPSVFEGQGSTSRWSGWSERLAFWKKSEPADRQQQLLQKLASQLSVRPSGQTRMVEVLFEARDPRLAADFTNTLVDEFVEQSHRMRWESAQRTAGWLTAQLKEMKEHLEAAQGELQEYANRSGLTYTSEKGNIAQQQLQEEQQELVKAQAERAEKQAKFETAANTPIESLPAILDDSTMRDYQLKLTELQREHADLSSTLTPEHYRVRRVQAQIAELKSALENHRAKIVRRTANEYESARRRENLLRGAYDRQVKVVAEQTAKEIRYDTLKREVDTSRQLYNALLQRVKEAGLAAAMRASNVLVVDPAKPPRLPYRPNYPLNCAIGLFLGAFLGMGLTILRERLNQRIQVPGIAQQYLNLPELGAIPMIKATPARHGLFARPKSQSNLLCPTNNESGPLRAGRRGTSEDPQLTRMTEAFRATLSSILLPSLGSPPPRVIVLTSTEPGVGKTTIASNLAITMAGIGRRVLLIDSDLRRPRLHRIFQVSDSWGLSDVLRSKEPIDRATLLRIAHHSHIPGLDLLPSGDPQEKPSCLLYSQRLAELLALAAQTYELVLIDAPPMMQLADARVLGRLSDGVILVMQAGRTTLESLVFSRQRFAEDGTRVLGTILNSWDPKDSAIYGDDYYYAVGGTK